MDLMKYCGNYVIIEDVDGKIFKGWCCDYFHPDEIESGLESIVVNTLNGDLIEFYEHDIENIWICDKDSVKNLWIQKQPK